MTDTKKSKRKKNFTIEEVYQNKNFVHPKEKNLETIFEEPRETKDGLPILTSTRKFRRYLDFDPSSGKIQKRKKNAQKCSKKLIGKRGRTRSITKAGFDIALVLEAIDNSSDDSLMNISLNQSDCNIDMNESDCSHLAVKENINLDISKVNKELEGAENTLRENKEFNDKELQVVKTKEEIRNNVNVAVLSDKCV